MTTILSHQQAGNLGEALALAKINSLGHAAYMSPDGAPGHDLMVVVDGKALSVEVKTRQHVDRPATVGRWPVNMKTKGDADLFLFVELNIASMTPTFYLLTNAQAQACHSETSGGNCIPAKVRATVAANDFRALETARCLSE